MAKRKSDTFPESDWLAELARLGQSEGNDDGHLTVAEIAERRGVGKVVVQKMLGRAKRAGRLSVRQVVRERLDGLSTHVPAYRVVSAKP